MDTQKKENKAEEYLNNWKRAEADLINYKKEERDREKKALEFGKEVVILDFVEIMDDLEEALRSNKPDEHQSNTGYRDGIEMTLKKFISVLERYGVKRIETKGEKFNPEIHEAISGEGGMIKEEIRTGYTMHDKVIRPARVIINQ